jgi:hypothetical protein
VQGFAELSIKKTKMNNTPDDYGKNNKTTLGNGEIRHGAAADLMVLAAEKTIDDIDGGGNGGSTTTTTTMMNNQPQDSSAATPNDIAPEPAMP